MQSRPNPIMFWKSGRKLGSSGESSDSLHLSDLAMKNINKDSSTNTGDVGNACTKSSNHGSANSSDHNSGSTHGSSSGSAHGSAHGSSGGIGDSFKNSLATVATKRDSVFKSFRMSLQMEEVGVSRSSSLGSSASTSEEKKAEYVEVGVNELYQHKLGQCIFSATEREEFAVNKSQRHLLIDDHSPALKPLDRRRVRDSMQSLVSIERQLAKNRISNAKGNGNGNGNGNGACDGSGGGSDGYEAPLASESPSVLGRIRDDHSVALKPMDRRRVRDSMQSLVSIERQLAKNYLAQPQPATGNTCTSKSASQPQAQPKPAPAAPSPSAPRRGRRGSVTRRRRASLTALSLDDICEDEAQVDASVPSAGAGTGTGTNSNPTTTGVGEVEDVTFRLRDDQGNDLLLDFHKRRTSCASAISSLGDSAATSNASSTGDWSFSLAE